MNGMKKYLYRLHFDEANCPSGDEPFSHDIFITSDTEIDDAKLNELLDRINTFKRLLDKIGTSKDFYVPAAEKVWKGELPGYADWDDVESLYEELSCDGWDNKIDSATELAVRTDGYKDLNIEMVNVPCYKTRIN